jgi:mitochondrial fission protein ELM1
LIWLVLGDKRGDNAQVEIVEQQLPWPCIRKHVQVKDEYAIKKPHVRPTLHHIDLELSDPLQAPWPDIILTVGRRPSSVAFWIKQQSAGHTRIVLFGKPSSRAKNYDLIITSSEILMPPLPNILTIGYPLMRVDQQAINVASQTWQPRLADRPRPLIAIMIGGPTKPYVFNQDTAQRIIKIAQSITSQQNGTAYLVTSRRTPQFILELLSSQLPEGCRLYRWDNRSDENPYKALLGIADGFIVTEDSISMIVEVAKLGKALAIFPLSSGRLGWLDQQRRRLTGKLFSNTSETLADKLRIRFALCLYTLRIANQVRDYRAFQDALIAQGHAVRVGQPLTTPDKPIEDDLSRVTAAIKRFAQN